MATMTFRSDSNFACTACVDLANWIVKNNYRSRKTNRREIYLPLSTTQNVQLMEIQIPITNR